MGFKFWRSELIWYEISDVARMRILKRLLPKIFPSASWKLWIFIADMETIISGRLVVRAMRRVPTKVLPRGLPRIWNWLMRLEL